MKGRQSPAPGAGIKRIFRAVTLLLTAALVVGGLCGAVPAAAQGASGYRDEVLVDGPRAYWRLGESVGPTAFDQTGAHPGVYENGPSLGQSGAVGDADGAVRFDGINDQLRVADGGGSDSASAFSIETWIKPAQLPSYTATISRRDGQHLLRLRYDGALQLRVWKNGSGTELRTPTSLIGPGAWYHVVVTYDGSQLTIWRDGTAAATRAIAAPLGVSAQPLYLASSGGYDWFNGTLDEFALYNTALTPARIAAHLNSAYQIDTTAPDTTIDSGPADGSTTTDKNPSFAFTATEAGSTFECRLDNGSWSPCSSPETHTNLSDGNHSFDVRASDPSANTDQTPATRSWTIDTTAPDTTIDSGPADGSTTTDKDPSFAFTATEAGSTFECRLDNGSWSPCSSPETLTDLADGNHSFDVRASDPSANTDQTPATRSWTIDTTAPDTTIDSGPADGSTTTDKNPSFAFTATEAGSTFECRLDNGSWSPCSSPETLTDLADGNHSFDVRASDPSANTDQTPATRSWTIDTNAPPVAAAGADQTVASEAGGVVLDGSGSSDPDGDALTHSWTQTGGPGVPLTGAGSANPSFSAPVGPATLEFLLEVCDPDALCATDTVVVNVSAPAPIDTTAPDTTIESGPADGSTTTDKNPSFAFTATEAGSTFECRLDNGSWSPCSSPETHTNLADGNHSFDVRASDPSANTDQTPATRSWTIDTTAPDTTIDSGPADGSTTTDKDPSFAFTATEAGSTFECRLDNGSWSPCTSPETLTDLADGNHSFDVRASDPSANTDQTPATRSWTIDTTAPDTTIDSGPADGSTTTDKDPSFAFTATEAGSTFECRLDNGSWSPCSSPETLTDLADGNHSFDVRASDPSANTDPIPASRSWTIDTTAPDTLIDSGPADGSTTTDKDPSFAFTATEAGSTFECRLDNGSWSPCSSPETLTDLADGNHTFDVRASDPSANTDQTPATRSWTIDTNAPPVAAAGADQTVASEAGGVVLDGSGSSDPDGDALTHSWTQTGGPGVPLTGAGSANPSFSAPVGPATLEFLLEVCDPDALCATDTVVVNVSAPAPIDTTAPDTTIESGPADGSTTTDKNPSFAFTATEAGSTFECRLDNGSWSPCSSPETHTNLADGNHSFDVRASDPSANTDQTPATRSWTIDTTAPDTTIDSGPADGSTTTDKNPSFAFTATEAGSTFECRLDNGSWSPCSSPETHTNLSDGNHSFDVRASDPSANTDQTPATRSWTIDTTAPDTTIDSGPADGSTTTDKDPSFAFTATEAGSTFECRLDNGSWSPCSSPETLTDLADGNHSFDVRASDPSANTDQTPATRSWTIDTTAPDTLIDSGPADGSTTTDKDPSFAFTATEAGSTFECRLDNGSWSPCSSPETLTDLADGNHSFDVRASDPSANTDQTPATRSWTIDTTAPDTLIDSGPADGSTTTDKDPSFAFTATEAGSTFECRLDNGSWSPCTSPETLTDLADGNHSFDVRASDPSANTDQTPATRSWTIDTTAPDTLIDSGPADGSTTTDKDPSFAFTATEAGSTFECRLDNGSWSPCTSPETLTDLADGNHTFDVRASDPSANTDQTPATRSWTIDTQVPASGYSDEVLVDGPRGYWRLGESVGPTAFDQTGAHPGIYENGPSLGQSGAVGDADSAVRFDGVNDQLRVADGGGSDSASAFSIETWIKPAQLPSYTATISRRDVQHLLRLRYDGALELRVWRNGSSTVLRTAKGLISTGAWYHVVVTYDGSQLTIWRDGTAAATRAIAAPLGVSTKPLYLASSGGYDWFNGTLDEFALYDTALTPARIAAHLNRAYENDGTAPTIELKTPTTGSTMQASTNFGGKAGTTIGDSSAVTVRVWEGPAASGNPVRVANTTRRSSGTFSVLADQPLPTGTYTVRAEQADDSGNVGFSQAVTFTVDAGAAPTLLAAGDVAYCSSPGAEATAKLLDGLGGTVAMLGDAAYERGTPDEFANCYDPTWGRHLARTRAIPGDHDYDTPNAAGYYGYFGAAAGDPSKGYYSYDLGDWHVVALNSYCYETGSCESALETWLAADLAANPRACTVALLHEPLFSSGNIHGNNPGVLGLWQVMYSANVDVVLSASEHIYERFGKQTPNGVADAQRGIREFIVGTGGSLKYGIGTVQPNSEVRNTDAYGILRLTLGSASYQWQFIPEAGRSFTDAGSDSCH